MYPVKQSTALTVPIFACDSTGTPVTGIADGSWTKRISKNGGSFGAMTVTITELENGWYSVPLGTGHTDTDGVLSLTFIATGALQVNWQLRVTTNLVDDVAAFTGVATASNVSAVTTAISALLPAALVGGRIDASVGAMASAVLTASAIASNAFAAAKFAVGAFASGIFAAGGIDNAALASGALNTASVSSGAIAAITSGIATATNVSAVQTAVLAVLPTALDASGNIKAQIKGADTNTINASALATDAVTEIAGGILDAATSSHTTSGTVGKAIGDTVGFGAPPSASTVAGAVADVALSGHTTSGSLAKAVSDTVAFGAPPSAATIKNAVLDEALSGHTTSGTVGKKISDTALTSDVASATSTLASDITSATSPLATSSSLSSVATAVAALPGASTIAAAVLGVTVYGSRTLKGILRRLHAVLVLKAAGLQSAATTGTFYDEDGTTKLVEATIDNVAGTRATPSTLAGD